MGEGSPNDYTNAVLDGATTAAKSLFCKILPVSPYGSGFCRSLMRSLLYKFFRMRILEMGAKKIAGDFPGNRPD